MEIADIKAIIESGEHNKVKVALCDIDGVLRGKYMSAEKFLSAIDGGFGFCDVAFGWDSGDVAYDKAQVTGWHTGYPDAKATIDLSTMRNIPWEGDVPMFLVDLRNAEKHAHVCPRTLFNSIITKAEGLGFRPMFSQEFEWFNFAETPQSVHEKGFRELEGLTPGMFGYSVLRASMENEFVHDLFDSLGDFGIPLEGLHTETGPGVYEAAITYSTAMEAADRAALFKTAVKELAYQHGILATFMAKWNMDLPGCSGHVHQSLWDDKNNLFHADGDGMSDLMKHYMAGQLHCLPELLPMMAPTVNSYKRLVKGAWAPTTCTWAVDNRTVALRALPGGSKSCRVETRVPGSDTNPYLAMAACLAAGLYGIENKLSLRDATQGSGYEDKDAVTLANNLQKSTGLMRDSKLAVELFGKGFVDHFCTTREWEWKQFSNQVTDWELKRYFEII